jgi:2'-5' RNA ligase
MHSIELLLDEAADSAVRADWALLIEAGLPSQGRHRGFSNAPHVTLLASAGFGDGHDERLRQAMELLPVPFTFSGLLVFGRPPRGLVLARAIIVTDEILRLHRAVYDVVASEDDTGADADPGPHSRPGAWTPHVTLASRLTPGELARAVELVSARDAPDGSLRRGRRWDPEAGAIVALDG